MLFKNPICIWKTPSFYLSIFIIGLQENHKTDLDKNNNNIYINKYDIAVNLLRNVKKLSKGYRTIQIFVYTTKLV